MSEGEHHGGVSRRELLMAGAAAAAATAVWSPAFRVGPADAAAVCIPPPDFPSGISLFQQGFANWADEIIIDDLWTCAPRSAQDIVQLADWAHAKGYRLRPRGAMHGWSPLCITRDSSCADPMVLLDLQQHMQSIELLSSAPGLIRAQTGATMDQVLELLEQHGLGFNAVPAPGDITIGGALAIDAHGTAIPALGEKPVEGHTYGSLSNLIVSLTAVVWDAKKGGYALRTFKREDSDCRAFLAHLGRACITEVQLRAGKNNNLRCVSYTDIPTSELFAAPGSGAKRTFASYLDQAGRAEAIWFSYTDKPWLKVWSVAPTKPAASRETDAPYNYVFSDEIPDEVSQLATTIIEGEPQGTPTLGAVSYAVSVAGLAATQTGDLWGPSKDTLLYIKSSTIRATANGYAVMCRRADIQRLIHDFTSFYQSRLDAYEAEGLYPMTLTVEIRVTGLDHPRDVGVPGARSPVLSAIRPRPDHPEWDVAVWFDALTFAGQPASIRFYRELEEWMFGHFTEPLAAVHPEWSKGWAYGPTAAWTDAETIRHRIPNIHRAGRKAGDDWDWAVRTLDSHDPHRVFSNAFLDGLLVAKPKARRRRKKRRSST